jgi:hypothetical protein
MTLDFWYAGELQIRAARIQGSPKQVRGCLGPRHRSSLRSSLRSLRAPADRRSQALQLMLRVHGSPHGCSRGCPSSQLGAVCSHRCILRRCHGFVRRRDLLNTSGVAGPQHILPSLRQSRAEALVARGPPLLVGRRPRHRSSIARRRRISPSRAASACAVVAAACAAAVAA